MAGQVSDSEEPHGLATKKSPRNNLMPVVGGRWDQPWNRLLERAKGRKWREPGARQNQSESNFLFSSSFRKLSKRTVFYKV